MTNNGKAQGQQVAGGVCECGQRVVLQPLLNGCFKLRNMWLLGQAKSLCATYLVTVGYHQP